MHIVICAKQVVDPDGVNSYALWGQLKVDESGRAFETNLPLIINAYDDQAIEAALRIRDDGVDCTITAISVGAEEAAQVLKHCVAMGCDQTILINDAEAASADGFRTAALLAGAIRELGDVDLVLCGRQASDHDQGTVPAVLAERLDAAYVTVAMDVRLDGEELRVTRAVPAGEEIVMATLPTVVTVSNEIGIPRYPTSRGMIAARRKPPTLREASEFVQGNTLTVELAEIFIPEVQGNCQMIDGPDPAAQAAELMRRLEEEGVL